MTAPHLDHRCSLLYDPAAASLKPNRLFTSQQTKKDFLQVRQCPFTSETQWHPTSHSTLVNGDFFTHLSCLFSRGTVLTDTSTLSSHPTVCLAHSADAVVFTAFLKNAGHTFSQGLWPGFVIVWDALPSGYQEVHTLTSLESVLKYHFQFIWPHDTIVYTFNFTTFFFLSTYQMHYK